MSWEEKTEQATPRRREEVRRRGQVPRSGELTAAVAFLVALLAWRYLREGALEEAARCMGAMFAASAGVRLDESSVEGLYRVVILSACKMAGGPVVLAGLAGLLVSVAQTGFLISAYPLRPDWTRLNPARGLARLFSQRSAAELLKAMAKVTIVGLAGHTALHGRLPMLARASAAPLEATAAALAEVVFQLLWRAAGALVALALLDYLYQRWAFEREIRMSRQELLEEYRRHEGDPVTRQRIRERQRQVARQRMMAEVPRSDVVVTNPTQVAVALRYRPERDRAPQVVAKGLRLLAERIVAAARGAGVPVLQDQALARSLYRLCPVGAEIPPDLYRAVAEVLAYVYRMGRAA